jgi:phosphoribosylanthranilate isomerase
MFPLQDIFIKVCGITNASDAKLACSMGVNAIGFIFNRSDERYVPPELASSIIAELPDYISKIGVFHHADRRYIRRVLKQVPLSAVQLQGKDGPDDLVDFDVSVLKQFQMNESFDPEVMRNYLVDAFVLKNQKTIRVNHAPRKYHWNIAVQAKEYGRIILSGGLHSENIEDAIRFVSPYGIDVCSGVEARPGKIDPSLLRTFISNARNVRLSYAGDRDYE